MLFIEVSKIKNVIRALTPDETLSSEFAHLLWLAVEVGDTELASIIRAELTELAIVGAVDDAVEFYRRIGFTILRKDTSEPRWPERQRYECLLT